MTSYQASYKRHDTSSGWLHETWLIKLVTGSIIHHCWNSFVKLVSYESVLIYVKMQWVMSWGEIIWTLEHSIIFKWQSPLTGQWLVAGWVNGYISVYIHRIALVMLRAWYWVTTISYFVCHLDTSWGSWTGKCCYFCCLFCILEQWLLQSSSGTHYQKDSV